MTYYLQDTDSNLCLGYYLEGEQSDSSLETRPIWRPCYNQSGQLSAGVAYTKKSYPYTSRPNSFSLTDSRNRCLNGRGYFGAPGDVCTDSILNKLLQAKDYRSRYPDAPDDQVFSYEGKPVCPYVSYQNYCKTHLTQTPSSAPGNFGPQYHVKDKVTGKCLADSGDPNQRAAILADCELSDGSPNPAAQFYTGPLTGSNNQGTYYLRDKSGRCLETRLFLPPTFSDLIKANCDHYLYGFDTKNGLLHPHPGVGSQAYKPVCVKDQTGCQFAPPVETVLPAGGNGGNTGDDDGSGSDTQGEVSNMRKYFIIAGIGVVFLFALLILVFMLKKK